MLRLYDDIDTRRQLAAYLKQKRQAQKLSRAALAIKSQVPAPTIRRFEETGHISLKGFLALWLVLDDLGRLLELTKPAPSTPTTIAEVLSHD